MQELPIHFENLNTLFDSFAINGRWWRSHQPAQTQAGILKFGNGEIVLELEGAFPTKAPRELENCDVLYGESVKGQKYTYPSGQLHLSR